MKQRRRQNLISSHQCTGFTDVKVVKLSQRKISANVTVENKETFWIAGSDLISKVVETAGGSQFNELLQIANRHAIFTLHLVEEALHFGVLIRADNENFLTARQFTAGVDVMFDDGHASDGEEWLWNV